MMSKDTKPEVAAVQITTDQVNVLCTFFEENPEVIKGYKKTTYCINAVQSKWKKITPHLNSLGRPRDHKSWSKYLCNIKAKLKRKKIKWSQHSDGTGPIICNTEDFNDIELRMLQVLHKNTTAIPDSHDLNTSRLDIDLEDVKVEENSHDLVEHSWHEIAKPADDEVYIKLLDSDSPLLQAQVPAAQTDSSDEFDTFGKNIAQQLKTLPLPVALETQEILLSILRKQRLKVISGTQSIKDNKNKI